VNSPLFPNVRNLRHDDSDWRPLRPEERFVQFGRGGDDDFHSRVGRLVGDRTDVVTRYFDGGGSTGAEDLEFLRFMPQVRRFRVDAYALRSLDGLRFLRGDLAELSIGWTAKPLSLAPIARFDRLTTLAIERQHRGVELIAGFADLEDLTLRSMTLPDLSLLLPLVRLRSLDIKLGGTRNLTLLPRIGKLTYLELWMIRGLVDLDSIGEVETLESLFLQALKGVTHLPSLRRLTRLRTVHLETMRGLTDLHGVAEAPALEKLDLVDFRHARADIVTPFIGHPTLRETGWGFGSVRKNLAAQDLLPLDPDLADREAYLQRFRDIRAQNRPQA
jgi:hypothetical protein